jgi:protein-tyrosine phosphatase
MDMTWVTNRIAVGGGIWTDDKMIEVVRAGVTHVIDMQIEFDDTQLAEPYGVKVLWNPTDDDFRPKPPELFRQGVDFALEALDDSEARVFIHCAAGVHRAPMMALALLRALGFSLSDAIDMIQSRRNVVDFADVYVESVEEFIRRHHPEQQSDISSASKGRGVQGTE